MNEQVPLLTEKDKTLTTNLSKAYENITEKEDNTDEEEEIKFNFNQVISDFQNLFIGKNQCYIYLLNGLKYDYTNLRQQLLTRQTLPIYDLYLYFLRNGILLRYGSVKSTKYRNYENLILVKELKKDGIVKVHTLLGTGSVRHVSKKYIVYKKGPYLFKDIPIKEVLIFLG